MGAKTFVHYTFPRHMSMELLAGRTIMEQQCAQYGMRFVNQMAPDPMGEQPAGHSAVRSRRRPAHA
jgi:hypothetical protein